MVEVLTRPKTGVATSEAKLVRALCKRSYYDFLKIFWHEVVPEQPIWNWHIEYLCSVLQESMEDVFAWRPKQHDIICNISPGSTKSLAFTVFPTPWAWTRFPSFRMIGGSHGYDLSMDLSNKSRLIVHSDLYRAAFPEIKLRDDTKGHWENSKGGARYATSVGSKITGKHAHVCCIDDPLDPESSYSEEKVKVANRWCTQTIPSRKVDKLVAPTWLVMQRLC